MSKTRLISVDLLRGITIAAMILVNTPGSWSHVYSPLLHAKWHGLTPTDLVFPFFLFIVGISISLAYHSKIGNVTTYKKITFRSIKLLGLGVFLSWFLPYWPFFKDIENLRILGVLQRIGIVFFICTIAYLNCSWKTLLWISIVLLIGYFVLLGFVSLPNGNAPSFDRVSNNWALFVDSSLLGKHMWKSDYDPEGLLSTLPAIVTCFSGIFIGQILKLKNNFTLLWMIPLGILMLILGYVWSIWFPINKALWTSSFVLVTSGYATLSLSILFFLNDVLKISFGRIFSYVGTNAIGIYFLSSFLTTCFYSWKIKDVSIHNFLYQEIFMNIVNSAKFASMLYALSVVSFYLLLGHIMFKKRIIIKV